MQAHLKYVRASSAGGIAIREIVEQGCGAASDNLTITSRA